MVSTDSLYDHVVVQMQRKQRAQSAQEQGGREGGKSEKKPPPPTSFGEFGSKTAAKLAEWLDSPLKDSIENTVLGKQKAQNWENMKTHVAGKRKAELNKLTKSRDKLQEKAGTLRIEVTAARTRISHLQSRHQKAIRERKRLVDTIVLLNNNHLSEKASQTAANVLEKLHQSK